MADRKKEVWIELLRIAACFAVIILHMGAQHFRDIPVDSYSWKVSNFYHGISRFAVACFIMISGYLYLNENRKLPIKKLYLKNILPLVVVFFFWQFFYGTYLTVVENQLVIGSSDFFKRILIRVSKPYFHLWYLPMLIGLLIITPILREVLKGENGKRLEKYIILLYFVFQILPVSIGYFPVPNQKYIKNVLGLFQPELVTSYAGYYVLGHYLGDSQFGKKKEFIVYGLGILFIGVGILLCQYYSVQSGVAMQSFYENYTVPTFFYSSAVFLFFKNYLSKIKWGLQSEKVICRIGNCTFGIYLIHAFFRDILKRTGIDSLTWNTAVGIPLIAVFIFILSYIAIEIIKAIPGLKKWIV